MTPVILIALAAFGLLIILWMVSVYNGLVKLRQRYKNAYAQIDVQLKRRYDLIPNLVETAKSFMKHESETLEAVIRARSGAMAANKEALANPGDQSAMSRVSAAEGALHGALHSFWGLSESYPELSSNQNMLALQEELTSTENKIGFARQSYNDSVTAYNTSRETFPNNILAGVFGFLPAALFELADPLEREAPKVKF